MDSVEIACVVCIIACAVAADNYRARYTDASFRSVFRVGRGCFDLLCDFVKARWELYNNKNKQRQKQQVFAGREDRTHALLSRFERQPGGRCVDVRGQQINNIESSELQGIHGVAGAVDGTLVKRARPVSFWGWYCRKGFTAYNVMGVVNSKQRFQSFSIRTGSSNDQSVWSRSLGRNVHKRLPQGMFFLGDVGYFLKSLMVTPLPHERRSDPVINRFNKMHSRTRIAVEMAFDALKGWLQILRRELDINSEAEDGKVVVACVVLHNFILQYESSSLRNPRDLVAPERDNSTSDEMVRGEETAPDNEFVALQKGREQRAQVMRNIILGVE